MQAVSSFTAAFSLEKASIALLFLTTGISSDTMALPIIGPPIRIFLGSCLYPPQNSMTSQILAPIGTITFFGWATASPSTVTLFETRGIPVLKYLPTNAIVVTFDKMTPSSAGSTPAFIFLPVISYTRTLSAPLGYLACSLKV